MLRHTFDWTLPISILPIIMAHLRNRQRKTLAGCCARILHPTVVNLIISTKADYTMSYCDCGSKKYLVANLNQSLWRLRLDYMDIFYHHRPEGGADIRSAV
ncbi:MAG: hypothetical protein GPOALKHO_000223 [Sodalis sp.]|nr:MAG: hypothetical protein GPOALKHO_000223 [Sodalis sp.]